MGQPRWRVEGKMCTDTGEGGEVEEEEEKKGLMSSYRTGILLPAAQSQSSEIVCFAYLLSFLVTLRKHVCVHLCLRARCLLTP